MCRQSIILVILYSIFTGPIDAAELERHLSLNDGATSWIVDHGAPLYYTSNKSLYRIEGQTVRKLILYDKATEISSSPSGNYRLFSLLEDLDGVKNGQRYSDYFILNDLGEVVFKVSRSTPVDLKPYVAAISDQGVLALADPVNAKIFLYQKGELITEGQLYEDEGSISMERNIHLQWVGEQCYILLERPGFNGQPGSDVLFIRIEADGRGQITRSLPFLFLQEYAFHPDHLIVSGYNYSAETSQMDPLIVEITNAGEVLWTNQNFGHELVLSANGEYLATLSSHELIQVFNLKSKRIQVYEYPHENLVSLGLAVNNSGETAVIRVPVDFFVKRNTYFANIYQPHAETSTSIQIDPRYPKLFQIHSNGSGFYIGTNYEWLEIR